MNNDIQRLQVCVSILQTNYHGTTRLSGGGDKKRQREGMNFLCTVQNNWKTLAKPAGKFDKSDLPADTHKHQEIDHFEIDWL